MNKSQKLNQNTENKLFSHCLLSFFILRHTNLFDQLLLTSLQG